MNKILSLVFGIFGLVLPILLFIIIVVFIFKKINSNKKDWKTLKE